MKDFTHQFGLAGLFLMTGLMAEVMFYIGYPITSAIIIIMIACAASYFVNKWLVNRLDKAYGVSVITTARHHCFKPGELLALSLPEKRWYIRFYYWITFRKCPLKVTTKQITDVTTSSITYKD